MTFPRIVSFKNRYRIETAKGVHYGGTAIRKPWETTDFTKAKAMLANVIDEQGDDDPSNWLPV